MEIFVARQPIFDKSKNVYAYEILYRSNSVRNEFNPDEIDADTASTNTVMNTFTVIGLDKLTNGKKAFINFTDNLVKNGLVTLFPSSTLVVEILETVKPTPEILEACRKLKHQGYKIALDDFVISEEYMAFLPVADIIKIDLLNTPFEDVKAFVKQIKSQPRRPKPIKLLAEKIETEEMFNKTLEMGFSYFQGYFFSKPVIVSGKALSPIAVNRLRLIQITMRDEFEFAQVAEIIKQDVALSYRLLRLVNSAYFAFANEVVSIQQALVILGSLEVKRWVSLVSLMDINPGKTNEVTRMALIRAKFLESIAERVNMKDNTEDLYMMGMFSLMDVMMERPMEEVLAQIPLPKAVSDTLITRSGKYYNLLNLISCYERGDFDEAIKIADTYNLDSEALLDSYVAAIEWTSSLNL